ncbi:unnamed protein product [Caenorhabditis auriculariae]|uniref:Phlebovirus glycoprotein G2 fusion domain-containing protein n=1 Tax=Caenorhabditis auriculariae TaxID=2777116 RepID=A0A8S1GS11_9PELO|nr:unnamed protein product [Caenorhabditis auriculariae]
MVNRSVRAAAVVIPTKMRPWLSIVVLGFVLAAPLLPTVTGQEKAEVDIRVSGACSPIYLSRKGIDVSKYRPSIRFNPDKIELIPKNPVIPGCIKIRAQVEILEPVKKTWLRKLKCESELEGTCVFCDFCKQLKSQSAKITSARSHLSTHKNIEEDCKCDEMAPGLYDIETEQCTPEIDDVKDYIPPEIQTNILEKRPISMFITVYLMDLEPPSSKTSFLSAFGKAILQKRMAKSTVACFLLGIDVKLALPSFS